MRRKLRKNDCNVLQALIYAEEYCPSEDNPFPCNEILSTLKIYFCISLFESLYSFYVKLVVVNG